MTKLLRSIPLNFLCFFLFFVSSAIAVPIKVSNDARALLIDGERKLIISGAIHYPRSTPEMWPDIITNTKDGGVNAIETYIFWNLHEPKRREYDFKGGKDFIRFFKTIQSQGLYAILRIGPYVCAEWNYGGFPVWLHNIPGIKFRTNNQPYKDEMQTFTNLIVDMAKKANLFASQGGPIILAQIENEYGNVMSHYGNDGKEYVKWCAQLAQNQKIAEPWLMCQQDDAPEPMLNTCNGYYCDQFTPNRNSTPKFWTENWTGWYAAWGETAPHRPAEDLAFAVARFFQNGGSLQNYYMYHGGSNFARSAGGPYFATSYDYDAVLDEYGNPHQPKWGHLKQLHEVLYSMETNLLQGEARNQNLSDKVYATTYSSGGNSSCFIANTDEKNDATITFQGKSYTVPAWSVSILPDCNQEAYNTAKVNTQTNVMVKKPINEAEQEDLQWVWMGENFRHLKMSQLQGDFTFNRLIDQKEANDTSDYLWYMTSVNVEANDPLLGSDVILRVNTSGGHVIHAFHNGRYKASKIATKGNFKFVFDTTIQLVKGINQIGLLSVTVGYQNYGEFFDEGPDGIVGTVQLIGSKNSSITKDLTTSQWFYIVGLDGEKRAVYMPDGKAKAIKWHTERLALNSKFTWYKTTFKTPLGEDPVVIDFKGMGKGMAWVNGNNIGRYWPTALGNSSDGCPPCDYRGEYKAEKCRTGCGLPTQRWYHVPRSYLDPSGENTLVLFEEMGGNPSFIKVQTVGVEKACANAYEGSTLQLSCPGKINEIKFASFGDPKGACGTFKKGTCESATALAAITKACAGKPTCSIAVNEAVLGPTGCTGNTPRKLVVEAIC